MEAAIPYKLTYNVKNKPTTVKRNLSHQKYRSTISLYCVVVAVIEFLEKSIPNCTKVDFLMESYLN